MANFIITNAWKEQVLTYLIASWNVQVGIYTNTPYTWSATSAYADFTQPTWPSYADISTSGWTTPALDGSSDGYINATAVTFTNNSSVTNYTIIGCYYFDSVSGTLVGGGEFAGAILLTPGMQLVLPVEMQTQSQF